mgnify:CR=1 FL=1
MPIKDTLSWDMLALLMIEDMMHSDMNEHLFDELDEMFKGIAMNGQGIGIDFEEIRKAEKMYEKKESK